VHQVGFKGLAEFRGSRPKLPSLESRHDPDIKEIILGRGERRPLFSFKIESGQARTELPLDKILDGGALEDKICERNRIWSAVF
jgi:hypothetical protein